MRNIPLEYWCTEDDFDHLEKMTGYPRSTLKAISVEEILYAEIGRPEYADVEATYARFCSRLKALIEERLEEIKAAAV